MEKLTIEEIVGAINGRILNLGDKVEFDAVSTDTRDIPEGSIFIALKGEKFNGNDYVKDAALNGAALCIIDEVRYSQEEVKDNVSVVLVDNCRTALLDLAEYYRSKLPIRVIGITGSTGKTSTKDLVAAALGAKFKVFKTKGNFNNEIGLPLMIFKLDSSYDIAVLEMGMSNFNEIHNLVKVARPDMAIITNIGVSHIENLKTRENILKAKLEITDYFNEKSVLIINNDNDLLSTLDVEKFKIIKTGIENGQEVIAKDIELNEGKIRFKVEDNDGHESDYFDIPVPGKHNILNSLLAIACCRELGMSYDLIADGISNLETTSMRLDIVKGNKFTIIDDCYNASPDSMRAAIDVLSDLDAKRRIAILGTMKELGETSYGLHKEIGEYVNAKNIDTLIVLGEYADAFKEGCGEKIRFESFSSFEEVSDFLDKIVLQGDAILVKASRSMKFETIVKKLKMIDC